MRGVDHQQGGMFSYLSPEERVRKDHRLRGIRGVVDKVLGELSGLFNELYSVSGRPSIPAEKLRRALLLQMLYSIRSERLLMEEIDYSVLFRWFVGMNRYGMQPPSPRTGSGCWMATWRGSFSPKS